MAGIRPDIKVFIVQRLACYDPPTVVANAVKEEFGVEVTRQAVHAHDPNTYGGRNLAKKWRTLFEKTRSEFIDASASVSISHKQVRLRALERMAVAAESRGNMGLTAQLLEQAAKECGDAYVNKRGNEGGGSESVADALHSIAERLTA